MKNASILLLLLAFFLGSCDLFHGVSIEKRRYSNGFYVHKTDHRSTDAPAEPAAAVASTNEKPQPAAVTETAEVTTPVTETEQAMPVKTEKPLAVHAKQQPAALPASTPAATPLRMSLPKNFSAEQPMVIHHSKPVGDSDLALILMVLLAIFLSPIAVLLKEGTTIRFWLDLICWLIGIGVVFVTFFGGLFLLFAVIYALLIVLDAI